VAGTRPSLAAVVLALALAACAPKEIRPDAAAATRLLEEGRAAARRGDHQKAVALFSDAVRHSPESAEAFYERGVSRVQLRLSSAARDDVRAHEEEAFRDFSSAIRLNPAYGDAYFNRAMVASSRGQFRPAAQDLLEAVRMRPRDPEPHLWLGRIYEEKFDDRGLAALDHYEKYVDLGGTDPDAREKVRVWKDLKRQAAPPTPAPGARPSSPEDEDKARKAHEDALRLIQDGRRDEGVRAVEALLRDFGHTRYVQDPQRALAIRAVINAFKPK
jgi:tetratricopeptide (TPR) repeat protein